MPLYDYKCDSCGYEWEEVYKIKDNTIPLTEPCPACDELDSVFRLYTINKFIDPGILNADKNMERSGVQEALERIRDNAGGGVKMKWKG